VSLQVAIVTDEPGWHGRALKLAFAKRGAVARYVSLTGAVLDLAAPVPVALPGYPERLPDAVFVRGVPGGTLAQVVFHLNVLHALHDLGIPVYNDGRAIERSVDKSLTTLRLRQAGIATPDTWVTSDERQAKAWVEHYARSGPLVCKPLFGSQGKGVCLVHNPLALPSAEAVDHVWYLQRFIGIDTQRCSDWRVLVVGGRAVAAMRRDGRGWLANVAQGAECHAALPEGPLRELSEAAVACLDMAYAGVDLMCDRDGRWWVIEVNSIPAWRGLQSVANHDVAELLVDDLLRRCDRQHLGEVVS
jgi:tetrahydromethanopterin:alpha-L-glutamate ligase